MICENCKKENDDDAIFCFNCGLRLVAKKEENIYCQECGQKLPLDAKFCLYCGNPIGVKKTSEKPQKKETKEKTVTKKTVKKNVAPSSRKPEMSPRQQRKISKLAETVYRQEAELNRIISKMGNNGVADDVPEKETGLTAGILIGTLKGKRKK